MFSNIGQFWTTPIYLDSGIMFSAYGEICFRCGCSDGCVAAHPTFEVSPETLIHRITSFLGLKLAAAYHQHAPYPTRKDPVAVSEGHSDKFGSSRSEEGYAIAYLVNIRNYIRPSSSCTMLLFVSNNIVSKPSLAYYNFLILYKSIFFVSILF